MSSFHGGEGEHQCAIVKSLGFREKRKITMITALIMGLACSALPQKSHAPEAMLSGFASSLLKRVTGTDDPAVLKAFCLEFGVPA